MAEELAQSTLGELDQAHHVHITSDDFHDHEEEEGDEEEDADEGDEEHDYELGPGINDIILQQTNEVDYRDGGNYTLAQGSSELKAMKSNNDSQNADFVNQQRLLQQ